MYSRITVSSRPTVDTKYPRARSAADRQAIVDRHYVQVLQQYTRYRGGQGEWRDRGMADNVRWIADVAEPGSRIVVWAHNFHVNNFGDPFPWMGGHLEAGLGKDYLPAGFLFHHGAFQAMDRTGAGPGLKEFTVGPPLAGTVEDTFEGAGWPLCLLDLRRLPPSGPVAEWFHRPQPVRGVGSSFTGEADMAMEVVLPDLYEAVIYVEATTRARPNPPAQP
jgi:erythromycin esterase